MKSIVTTILMGLSLLAALVIEQGMKTNYTTEIVFIIIGIILTAGVLFGMWTEAEWSYALATLFFAASLANIIWLFTRANVFLTLTFGVLVNIAGLVICIVDTKKKWSLDELETYDLKEYKPTKRKKR